MGISVEAVGVFIVGALSFGGSAFIFWAVLFQKGID